MQVVKQDDFSNPVLRVLSIGMSLCQLPQTLSRHNGDVVEGRGLAGALVDGHGALIEDQAGNHDD